MTTKAEMNLIWKKLDEMADFDINCGETILFADSVDQEALFEFQGMFLEFMLLVAEKSGNVEKLVKKYPNMFEKEVL